MQWSKLKKTIEDKFSGCLKDRVNIFITSYKRKSYIMMRGWITIDGEEIANFSTIENRDRYLWNLPDLNNRIPDDERTEGNAVEKGEFSRWDFLDACEDFIGLSIEDALKHENPVVNAFAVLDARLGKRRLKILKEQKDLHPLVSKLLDLRLQCEGLKKEAV